jgi:tetratricopeptide (TPR) repeat protein
MLIQTQFTRFLLILLLALPFVARAASVDAVLDWPALNADVQRLQAEGHSGQAFSLLLSVENQLSGTPDFDYALGVLALEVGQYGLAQVSLERVVLVSPNHAGAWLDLAIASYKLGEVDAAQQIIRHIEENFNPPAPLRDQLNQVKKQLTVGSIAQGWHGGVIASYGYVQNPNSGLSDGRFSLTPTGTTPIAVEVDGSMRPKADYATQLRGNLYRTYQHASGAESTLSSAVLIKTYAQQSDFNLIDAMLAWDYRQPILQEGGWTLNLSPTIRTIAFGGETLGYFTTLSAGVTKKYQSCELGGRLDLEKRNYVKDNYFNATTPWLGATLGCMRNNMLFGAGVRYGKDFGEASRPGGNTQKLEANAYWRALLSERVTLGLVAYAAEYLDSEGYSTLLDHNNRRSIHRLSQRAELVWQLPTSANWALQAEVEHARDQSNIPTARIEDMQILLGLRYQFN